ncbi:serine/threonine protein kinase [Leeia sp.]|uniref:serine/threonine protein kinase n=1 Tax=Leeia sp. TaxID=2884678 RepID=UPI0035AE1F24
MNDTLLPPYADLTPDRVLDAVESLGLRCSGHQLALNSFENRVYQIGMEEGPPLVAKFYRPARWSDDAILEEHAFSQQLAEQEIPVVAPLLLQGRTLHAFEGFRFALFPRRGGRAPELDQPDTLVWMGRFLGRIHALGRLQPYQHRPRLDLDSFGHQARDSLLQHAELPPELLQPWRSVVDQALEGVAACYARAGDLTLLRLHGDCHAGNVLWTDAGPHFVDFDDSRMGPALQDLWMLLSGDRAQMQSQLLDVLAGYEDFCEFDPAELHLLEALRTLRLIHYSAWLAQRWHDPAFPAAFPWFNTQRYWEERILELREQIAAMQEGPLVV